VNRRITTVLIVVGMAGALLGAPAVSYGGQDPSAGKWPPPRSGHTPRPSSPAATAGPIEASDTRDIATRWGIQIESLRLTSNGYMLDFRYRVLDTVRAKPLFERKTKPVLKDEASGAEVIVPVPPKTGPLRSSNDPKVGRTYFMFFANPARFIKKGNLVTVTIGEFRVTGIRVETDEIAGGAR
jgi:hypothetical protein